MFSYLTLLFTSLVFANLLAIVLRKAKLQFTLTMVILALLMLVLVAMFYNGATYTAANVFSVTPFSVLFALIFTLGILLVNLLGYEKGVHYSNFAFLSSVALIGMYVVAFADSLVGTFIGLELISAPAIFSTLLSKRVAIEAGVKMFVLASISIALFSFGMVLVFGSLSTVSFVRNFNFNYLMLVALGILIVAISFEASLFPFNLWIPDVYQGAAAHVTAMLGGINRQVGFLVMMQILVFVFILYKPYFTAILYFLAILTMFYGNLAALKQRNVKRLMAYSAIAQAGYIAIGLAVATGYSFQAMIFQIFAHMLMFIGALGVVLLMESRNRNQINDYIGLYKENGVVAFSFAVILMSLIGIPFTMGFVGKFLLFSSAINSGMLLLALVGVINSAISVYYYLRIITAMYTNRIGAEYIVVKTNILVVILICTFLILLFGVYPNPIMEMAKTASLYLT